MTTTETVYLLVPIKITFKEQLTAKNKKDLIKSVKARIKHKAPCQITVFDGNYNPPKTNRFSVRIGGRIKVVTKDKLTGAN